MANKGVEKSLRRKEAILSSSEEEEEEDEGMDVSVSVISNKKRQKKAKDHEEKMKATRRRPRRLWSEADEIAMLQGIIDFKAKTKKTLSQDGPGSYRFVKKLISFEASYNQYMDKVRHLKKRYLKLTKDEAEQPMFRNRNDEECFKLSKLIWGDEETEDLESNVKSKKCETSKRNEVKSSKQDHFSSPGSDLFMDSYLVQQIESLGVDSVKQRWSMVPVETKKKINEELKSLYAKEDILEAKKRECALKKASLLHNVISLLT